MSGGVCGGGLGSFRGALGLYSLRCEGLEGCGVYPQLGHLCAGGFFWGVTPWLKHHCKEGLGGVPPNLRGVGEGFTLPPLHLR